MKPGLIARHGRRASGLAYVEVMVALVLVLVALVPALEALQSALLGGQALAGIADNDAALRGKMEQVLAAPFEVLNAETFLAGGNTATSVSSTWSDPVGPQRRLVVLYRTDGSAISSADTGLLRVRVAWESGGTALETLRAKWW